MSRETLPFWRWPKEHFADFHRPEQRIVALEAAVAKQRAVNKAILAYVEADIASTWMSTARELSEALQEALKEE